MEMEKKARKTQQKKKETVVTIYRKASRMNWHSRCSTPYYHFIKGPIDTTPPFAFIYSFAIKCAILLLSYCLFIYF